MLKIQFQGAAQTVTGSRTLIYDDKDMFMIDCGLFQGPKEMREKNWITFENAKQVKALVVTHSHIDHIGLIPVLWKDGFRGPIYCSAATAALCKIMLPDAGRLQEEDAIFANRTKYSNHNPALPLYTEDDAVACLELLQPTPYEQWQELSAHIKFRLTRSAHILGSAFVEMEYNSNEKKINWLFSGDVGSNRSHVLKEAGQVEGADELILESTYGDRVIPQTDTSKVLAELITKVISRKGTLIIPAFSVGRTQEILYQIEKLREANKVPDFPVYLDSPMALKATSIYQSFEDELKVEMKAGDWNSVGKSFRYVAVSSPEDSMLLCLSDEPKIVISAAGMLNGGRVLHHLKTKLPDSKSAVLFVGYQVPGTKGYLLKNGLGKIRIHHQQVDVEAEIVNMDNLSAHADSDELIRWVSSFKKKPSRIFLNHGEPTAMRAFQYRLKTELNIETVIPSENEEFSY